MWIGYEMYVLIYVICQEISNDGKFAFRRIEFQIMGSSGYFSVDNRNFWIYVENVDESVAQMDNDVWLWYVHYSITSFDCNRFFSRFIFLPRIVILVLSDIIFFTLEQPPTIEVILIICIVADRNIWIVNIDIIE